MRGGFRTAIHPATRSDEIADPLGPERRSQINSLIRQGYDFADAVALTEPEAAEVG